ncbi:MAG: hypothetical protein E6Q95_00400 [Chitinophagaceae bacterium]|nr:MAG: hypothetical protein E6Q95_00400 [Chitinophagaceae bacterium]
MRKIFALVLFSSLLQVKAQKITTKVENSSFKETPTYYEIIDWWKKLDALSPKVTMKAMGTTDAGFPLHLILVNNKGYQDIKKIKQDNQRIIFVNNGIHPGEPDGIDASMMLVRDIVEKKVSLPDNITLAIIPVYNIGGCLNRSENYRVDQNGPNAFGFRGNSQNYDLNRDFIKCDSKEAKTFTEIFHWLDADIFIDNHVSNGADYQHIMTLLTTQHNKMGGSMGKYLHEVMRPAIYQSMQLKNYPLIPYVNVWGNGPDKGWNEFWDSPRYGSGYGTLWNTFSFVTESHMLKPYEQRVKGTYALMQSFIDFASNNSAQLKLQKQKAELQTQQQQEFPIKYRLDSITNTNYLFKGYEAGRTTSGVSGLQVLFYDKTKPYEKQIPIYDHYQPVKFIKKPKAYIIPQGWVKVIELLNLNQVKMQALKKDTSIHVEIYYIDNYKSSATPYEGHHLNSSVTLIKKEQKVNFRKGDILIPMNQKANRFLIETLEPEAEDSYFVWNFFDGILGQKEGFSGYAFEPIAAEYLKQHPQLKAELEKKKATDAAFANSASAQLNFVYMNSPFYEPDFKKYPVFRVL